MRKLYTTIAVMFVAAACGADTDTGEEPEPTAAAAETTTTSSADTTTTTTAPTTTTAVQAADSSRDNPIAVGAVVQVGDWRLRVSGVTPDATDEVLAENPFNDPPEEGHQFFMATLEATFVGSGSSTFWVDMSLRALGDSNVAYEGFDAYCGVIPDNINDSGETFPGGTITGNVCWSIRSTDADSLVVIAEETLSFDDTRQFLSLDPSATPLDETTTVEGGVDTERGPTVAIGEFASIGDWDVRVVSVTPDATNEVLAENQFNDPPEDGHQFFIAAVEATYTGDDSSTFWIDMSLRAVGDSNVAYEGFGGYCGVIPDNIDNSGETFPGGTITGNVCWSIASSDADSLFMIAEAPFTFDDTRVFFALTGETP